METNQNKYQVKLGFLMAKIETLFNPSEKIEDVYDIPFPSNNIKLAPLKNEFLQNILDIFRYILDKKEFSTRSWLVSEAIIRASPSHYAAFDYRKSYINKVINKDIEFKGSVNKGDWRN